MKLYKLTTKDGKTRKGQFGETQWSPGFSLTLPVVNNPQLCTSNVIHAYRNVNLAFLLNPIHGNYKNPLLWEAEGEICCEDWER